MKNSKLGSTKLIVQKTRKDKKILAPLEVLKRGLA
jgi:hypothetical protein